MVENSREALVELAERVEKAEGADREIDAVIAVALSAHPNARIMDMDGFRVPVAGGDTDATFDIMLETPTYTADLDAAMSLVPEGCRALIDSDGCHCRLTNASDESWPWNGFTGLAGTMAQAITAAALRARSAATS